MRGASIGRAHRGATIVVALVLGFLALTLLVIGANSPYTHANLVPAYDERYTRTEQIVVGDAVPFDGFPASSAASAGVRGEVLYVTAGCAGCHGLDARGGPVGKPITTAAPDTVATKIRSGGVGMPPFATGLSDAQIAEIVSHLRSLAAAR